MSVISMKQLLEAGVPVSYTHLGKPITLGSGDLAVAFGKIGGGSIFGIPTPAIIMIVVFLVCGYVLNNTTMGRHTYEMCIRDSCMPEDKVYENNLINDTLSFNDYKFIIN